VLWNVYQIESLHAMCEF